MFAQLISEKTLLLIVTLVGMAMCTAGIGPVAARGAWLHPLSILGYILGVAILLIVAAALLNIPMPILDTARMALIGVVVLIVAKIALTQFHHALG